MIEISATSILRSMYIQTLVDDKASAPLLALSEAGDTTAVTLKNVAVEFDKADDIIKTTNKTFDITTKTITKLDDDFKTLEKALETAGIETTDLGDAFTNTKAAINKLATESGTTESALKTLSKVTGAADLSLTKLDSSATNVKNSLNILDNNVEQAKFAFKGLGKQILQTGLSSDKTAGAFRNARSSLETVGTTVSKTAAEFKKLDIVTEKITAHFKEFDRMAIQRVNENLVNLTTRLDRIGTNFQRGATSVMAISDVYEGFGKILVNNASLFGINEEAAAKMNEQIEHNVRNLMEISRVLMGVGDLFEMSGYFITQMIPKLLGLQATSKATSTSMVIDIRAVNLAMMTNPIFIIIAAITAIVILLAIAWKQNWGDMRDVFKRVTGRIFDTLNMLGINFRSFADILDWINKVFHNVFWGIWSVFEEVFNELIDVVQEVIIDILIPAVTEMTAVWNELVAPLLEVFDIFGGNKDLLVLVGKIIAYTILAPLIILVKTIKLLKAVWDADWGGIRKDIMATHKVFKPIFDYFHYSVEMLRLQIGLLSDAWGNAMTSMQSAIMGLWDWVSGIISHISMMFNLFVALVHAIGDMDWDQVASLASQIVAKSAVGALAQYVTTQTSNVTNTFNVGGVNVTAESSEPISIADEIIYKLSQLRAV